MQLTHYTVPADVPAPITIAQVSDLHGHPTRPVLTALQKSAPDLIAVTGDLFDHLATAPETLPFLRACATLAPTVYTYGNHEHASPETDEEVRACGVTLLQDAWTSVGKITVGGVATGFMHGIKQGHFVSSPPPNVEFLKEFARQEGFKLLLCHHPEYYPAYIRDLPVDLTLAGHAHGGQWCIGKRGIFAPGQGFFPRYTGGLYDGRLVVSRGLANTAPFPRFGNPTELVFIHLQPLDNA